MPSYVALPANLEAEKVVLGAMMISPIAADVAFGSLTEEDFSSSDERNRFIFRACSELRDLHKPIDPQTVIDMLVNLKLEKAAGGNAYIYELINGVINPDNIDLYIEMVHEQSVLRQLLLTMNQIQDEYSKGVADIGQFINNSNDRIALIAQKRTVQGMKTAKDVASKVMNDIETQKHDDKNLTGITSGYRHIDNITHGWQNGDMIIVAARPSMGKTALGMNFAYNAAHIGRKPVAFFSLEMSNELIMKRLIAARSSVKNDDIQTGFLDAKNRVKIAKAIEEIGKVPLYLDDTPNSTLGDIVAKAKKLKTRQPDLGLVVIDYLGRIRQGGKVESRQQEVSYISGELKTLARNLKVPVIVLCQLNRNVERSDSKIPQLSDLRESGSIEQDADLVLLLHRPDYYTELGQERSFRKKNKEEAEEAKPAPTPEERAKTGDMSAMDIYIAKNRNGKTGKVTLQFQRAYSRFDDPSPKFEAEQAALYAKYQQSLE